ncbi:MFS transporter [Bifidobacterium sp. 7101]|uniref:MFS transporter n=1 Tax=Bifidobacterium sp. 7101 TaxID=1394175 RepID=UPI0003F86A65|nr:MFS transporter [Bifidobacterium sp. 7101]
MLSKAATTFVALKDVLRHKPLVTLSLGAFFTSLVGGIVNLLLTIHVYDISGSSPLAVSALFLVTFMPNLIVAPLFSGIADKYNRRIVLAVGGTLRALCCLLLAFNHNIALSFILAFVITSMAAVMKPARYAKAAELVSDSKLSVLNSVLSFMINAAGIASGALAGLLTNFNSVAAFAVAAFGSLIAASLDGCYSHEEHNSKRTFDSRNGFRESQSISFWVKLKGIISSTNIRLKNVLDFIKKERLLAALSIVVLALWFGLGLQETLLVVFTRTVLHAPNSVYGYLNTIGSIGALIGAALAAPFSSNTRSAIKSLPMSLIASGIAFCAFALSGQSLIFAFCSFFVFSLFYTIANVIEELLEQVLSPNEYRASVMSTIGAVGTVGYLIGGSLTGWLSDLVGPTNTAILAAVSLIGAGIFAGLTMLRY